MDGPDARVTDSAIGVHVIGEDAAFAMTDGLITDNTTRTAELMGELRERSDLQRMIDGIMEMIS